MSHQATLALIRDTLALLKNESLILASHEDAQYFRTTSKKAPREKVIISAPKPVVQKPIPYPQPIQPKEIATAPLAKPLKSEPQLTPQTSKNEQPPVQTWRSEPHLPVDTFNATPLKFLMQKLFPQMPLIQTIPSDVQAKKIAGRWKTKNQAAPISILYFSESNVQKELLTAITKAIDVYFGPARLINAETIEKEKQWEAFLDCSELKLVIACDYTLWQLGDLMQYFKDSPKRTLKNIPLFLLPDLSLYLKDPSLKRSLWKAIHKNICS